MSEDVNEVSTESTATDGGSPQDLFAMLRAGEIDEPERESERQLEEFQEEVKAKVEGEEGQPEEAKVDVSRAATEANVASEKTYKFDGSEYTESQLREKFSDPDTLMDLLTAREQYKNLNRKHADTMERFKTVESELDRIRNSGYAQPPQVQQQQAAQATNQIKQMLTNDAKHWVDRGLVDKETYEAIPDVVHLLAYQQRAFQMFRDQVNEVYEKAVEPMIQTYSTQLAVGERNAIVGTLENRLDQVSQLGGVYEVLNDPETRAGFVSYLGQVNPEIGVLFDENAVEFLASQFVGFQRDNILSVYEQAAQVGQSAQAPLRPDARFAQGERPGASSGRREGSNVDIKQVLFSRG
jgi:hypothetical protein